MSAQLGSISTLSSLWISAAIGSISTLTSASANISANLYASTLTTPNLSAANLARVSYSGDYNDLVNQPGSKTTAGSYLLDAGVGVAAGVAGEAALSVFKSATGATGDTLFQVGNSLFNKISGYTQLAEAPAISLGGSTACTGVLEAAGGLVSSGGDMLLMNGSSMFSDAALGWHALL